VRDRSALLRGTFVDPFRAVDGMADVFRAWRGCGAQFRYSSSAMWGAPPSRYRTAFAGLARAMWQLFDDPAALPQMLTE